MPSLLFCTSSTLIPSHIASPFKVFPERYPTSLKPCVMVSLSATLQTRRPGLGEVTLPPKVPAAGGRAWLLALASEPESLSEPPATLLTTRTDVGRAAGGKGSSRQRPGRAPGPSTAARGRNADGARVTCPHSRWHHGARAGRCPPSSTLAFLRENRGGQNWGSVHFSLLTPLPLSPHPPFFSHVANAQSPVRHKF